VTHGALHDVQALSSLALPLKFAGSMHHAGIVQENGVIGIDPLDEAAGFGVLHRHALA
jgi:hypothetical protein